MPHTPNESPSSRANNGLIMAGLAGAPGLVLGVIPAVSPTNPETGMDPLHVREEFSLLGHTASTIAASGAVYAVLMLGEFVDRYTPDKYKPAVAKFFAATGFTAGASVVVAHETGNLVPTEHMQKMLENGTFEVDVPDVAVGAVQALIMAIAYGIAASRQPKETH